MSVHQIFREVIARAVFADAVLIHTLSKCFQNMVKIKVHFLFNFGFKYLKQKKSSTEKNIND
jgi:hypothetical protein